MTPKPESIWVVKRVMNSSRAEVPAVAIMMFAHSGQNDLAFFSALSLGFQ
jgi:hypothetical protein